MAIYLIVGIIAFGLNSSAYVSEIIRGGLNSIPKGQIEAGYSLGFKYGSIMKYIVLPQTIKTILPGLGNEFITLLKETDEACVLSLRKGNLPISDFEDISLPIKASILSAIVSFSGLSVHFQVKSIIDETDIKYSNFLKARVVQSFISFFLTLAIFKIL